MLSSMVKEHTSKQTARKEEQGKSIQQELSKNMKTFSILIRTKTERSSSIWK